MFCKHRSYWNLTAITLLWSLAVASPGFGTSSRPLAADRSTGSDLLIKQNTTATDATFDVLHYRLDVTIPLVTNALTGTVALTCRSLIADLDQINLDMDPTMIVSAVYKGTELITPGYDSTDYKLNIPFGQVEGLSDTFLITIEYAAADENNGFYSYEMSAYTDWAAGVFPCHDFPSDKARYDLYITVPLGVEVASVGLLEDRTVSMDGQWETFNWHTDFPVATHLVGMMMSRYYAQWSDWYITPVDDSIEVAYYIFERDTAEAKLDFIHIVDAMDFYSTLFGQYPFEKYGMAETEPMYYGGMEYQTMSMITSSWIRGDQTAENGLVHELAHQWWGDAVGFDDWPSMWLSEGFAEYTAALYTEYKYGDEPFQALMTEKMDRYLEQAATKDYSIFDPPFEWSLINIVYKKGAWVLHMLRRVVGTDNLWLILQNYYDTYKYSYATIAGFQAVAEEVHGSSLAWFFDQWIFDKGYPRITATHEINQSATDEYECQITLNQVQPRTVGPLFTMPLDLRLTGAGQSLDTTVWLNNVSQTYTIPLSFEPSYLQLDPEGWLLIVTESNSLDIPDQLQAPGRFQLENNYPNPFNSTTTLRFELPVASEVQLVVYDLKGRRVARLAEGSLEAGLHSLTWSGSDDRGREVPTGLYFTRLMTPGYTKSIKMLLLK